MTGFIAISRRIWEHEFFSDEEMTEREAWMWMLAQAAYKDTRHKVGPDLVPVSRGSFYCTLRQLRDAFCWGSDKRVRGFLNRLENEAMIGRKQDAELAARKTLITICNYEEFQTPERKQDASEFQNGRTQDALKKQGKQRTKDSAAKAACPKPDDFELAAQQEELIEKPPVLKAEHVVSKWNEIAKKLGKPTVRDLTPARAELIRHRIAQYKLEDFVTVFGKVQASGFLSGDRGRFCTFDWIMKRTNFQKIIEGNYDD